MDFGYSDLPNMVSVHTYTFGMDQYITLMLFRTYTLLVILYSFYFRSIFNILYILLLHTSAIEVSTSPHSRELIRNSI
jgi:hypothetical protein